MSRGASGQYLANTFVSAMALAALACFVPAITHWQSSDPVKFLCYLAVALLTSSLKIKLPGVNGTMSVNFLFILLGVLELSFGETLIIGLGAVLVQCYWKSSKRMKPIHVLFNLSQLPVGTAVAFGTHHLFTRYAIPGPGPLALLVVAVAYFAFNTLAMSVIIRLSEGQPILKVWSECYFWSLPYYMVGAAIVGLVSFLNRHIGWQSSLVVLPPVYLIYRSYRLYLSKLEDEKRHVEQVSNLHLQTIEALALAIEAKDHTTHEHLQRVRIYAMEVAKELGLSEDEVEALKAASVLHDIGKLAVPEHIISKPGKLTPEEFEKMKIHPIIGAEILEQVDFPYPVVPIVRAHHEKWNGSGYPNGLQGDAIPIGARILAAVDCLDALASDRQYRRALPLDEAMARVAAEAGTSFDPQVVAILQRRYIELERMAHAEPAKAPAKLSTDIKVERGLAPAAGFASSEAPPSHEQETVLDHTASIVAALRESQSLFELSPQLRLDDIFSMLSVRLKHLVAHDSMALYLRQNDVLVPKYVSGDNFRLFSALKIPLGQGLSGWVAQNNKPILNGNPSVEPGYLNDPTKYSTLRSAVAVPIEGVSGVVAVLALYRAQPDAFTKQQLRILSVVCSKVGFMIENAAANKPGDSAEAGSLNGLTNDGSLLTRLDAEMERCREKNLSFTILVADVDNFQSVNDRVGRLQGDHLLQSIAAAMKEVCCGQDYVARASGDGFAVIAPGRDREAAAALARHIEGAVAQAGKQVVSEETLKVSIGQASYPTDGDSSEQLLREADRRMYGSKRSRRTENAKHSPAVRTATAGK